MQETKQLILSLALIAILIPSGVYASFSNFSPINTKPGSESDVLMPHGHITFVVHDSKGNIKQYIQTDNKIVDNGLKETVDQLFGNQLIATSFTTTGATVKFIGVGTGTNAAAAGDTGLQTQRANKITGTVSTCSGICAQVQGTWAAGKLANSSSTTAAITDIDIARPASGPNSGITTVPSSSRLVEFAGMLQSSILIVSVSLCAHKIWFPSTFSSMFPPGASMTVFGI